MSATTPASGAAPATTGTRWSAVGASTDPDAATATRAAVEAATRSGTPALVLLFVSPWRDATVVARTAREVLGEDVPVVGCTTAGEIADDAAGSGQVVAMALGGDGLEVATAIVPLGDDPRAAGRDVARVVERVSGPHRALLLLCDGFVGARSELVRGAYAVTGATVPLVGGCAADEMAMERTWQIHGDEVATGAVVGVALASVAPVAVGVGHGWRRTGDPLLVTESDGHRILTIDDRPALDLYEDAIGHSGEMSTDEPWPLISLFHPLGLTRPGGEEIRAVLGVDFESRAIVCGDVPQGTVLSTMTGDATTVTQGTADACAEVREQLADHTPVALVAFDCAARRAVLGDEGIADEVRQIRAAFPGTPVAGFYTQGEFARTRGARGVHNATLVLLALA